MYCCRMALCDQFYLAGRQAPAKASLSLPFSAGQRREKIMKGSGVHVRAGRDPSPITDLGKWIEFVNKKQDNEKQNQS